MSKWIKLKSLADLTVGFVGTMAKHYENEGVPFLRSLNIKPFKIVDDDMKYISQEFCDKLSKSALREGDVVIVRTGIPGTCCVIPTEYNGCNCSDVVIVHPNTELVNAHYLAAFINIWGQRQIHNNKVGAIQQHFNVRSAEEMLIYLPDKAKQEKIADLVVAVNKKIENNNIVCFELETMAKTLYDYWFVQFDFPDENGRPYRTSGGAMEWNDQLKREIPKGWGVKSIIDEFDVCCGYPFDTTKFTEDEDGIPIIRIRDILENTISAKTLEIVDEKYKVNRGDLIVGMDGNFHMNFWSGHSALLNQRCFKISSLGYSVLIAYFSAKPYIKAREKNVTRTTVGHLSADDVQALSVLVPTEPEKQKFSAIFDDILNKICQTRSENEELTKLRDWLLPMLMNGQARVE